VCGGVATATHKVDTFGPHPEGLRFFQEHNLTGLCSPSPRIYGR
jgi:hypothetical protein